jgi:3-oxo-4-pregnene-20-carboxyl-CoA dehydrogenase alpha subunit
MDFALDETQREIAALARATLARESDRDTAWKALGQAGLLSLVIPERMGGDGLGLTELAALLTQVGRAAAPVPVFETFALGVLPVLGLGTGEQQERLLAEVAAGNRVLTAAPRARATVSGPGVLSGNAPGVRYAARAHRILVPAGELLFLVDPSTDGVALVPTHSSSDVPEWTVQLTGAAAEPLGGAGAAAELHRFALAGACVLGSGLVSGALELTAAHVRTREQFGRPLATFQAVAQQIADVYIADRTLHLAAWSACRGLGSADGDLDVAGYWLAEEAPAALHTCHHLHGGLGVDAGYPLHRYYSAVKDLVRFVGGGEHRLAALATRIVEAG